MNTEYRDIPGFVGYRVGNDGSVWSRWFRMGLGYGGGTRSVLTDQWHQLSPGVLRGGYLGVVLMPGRKSRPVHILVLESFVGPRPKGAVACHGDGNPANNQLDNLRWDTQKSNLAEREKHGTLLHGDNHHQSKIDSATAREIRYQVSALRRSNGKLPSGYLDQMVAKYGISRSQIKRIARGESWSRVRDAVPCPA